MQPIEGNRDYAELTAYRAMFGAVASEHEWWMPGNNMGDPEQRLALPLGHDHLLDWQQRESKSGCRRCRFEALVAEASVVTVA